VSTGPWNPPASRETYERVKRASVAREPRTCFVCGAPRVLYMMNKVGTCIWFGACALHRADLQRAALTP
jgi:hypothetical protein